MGLLFDGVRLTVWPDWRPPGFRPKANEVVSVTREMGPEAFSEGVCALLASYRAIPPGATVRLAKKTSNLSANVP